MQLSCIKLEYVLNYERDAEYCCNFGIKSKFKWIKINLTELLC